MIVLRVKENGVAKAVDYSKQLSTHFKTIPSVAIKRIVSHGVTETKKAYRRVGIKRKTGIGLKSINGVVEESGQAKNTLVRGIVGTWNKPTMFLELGTRPHWILPRKGKFLAFTVTGLKFTKARVKATNRKVFARKVRHPGIKPYGFFEIGVRQAQAYGYNLIRHLLFIGVPKPGKAAKVY